MKKIAFFFCVLPTLLWGQSDILTGKLIKKNWSKSTQSYCAQGSDYFVIQGKGISEIVLDFDKNKITADKFIDKKVVLTGKTVIRTIKKNNDVNNMEQRPININPNGKEDNFSCKVFEVSSAEVLVVKKRATKNK